jgi:DNA-binding XRE family transcriptional regulator
MKEPIEHQIIQANGKPMFVIVPYEEYKALVALREKRFTIPHAVVRASVIDGKSRMRAWREYKKLSQKDIAERLGVSQSAYAQMEKPSVKPRMATLRKIAEALDIPVTQLAA